MNGPKDPPVEEQHDDAGDVEGAHGGKDKEVRVVEGADGGGVGSALGVVHAERDGGGDGDGYYPSES